MSVSSSGSSTSQGLGYINTAQSLAALLGTTNTSLTSLGAPGTLSGLSSGIDDSQIIAELMEVNQVPQQQLQTQLNSASTVLASYEKLTRDIATLQSVSATLESPSGWQAWIPDSTTQDATATVGTGAIGGSLTFSVGSLAQADSMISSGNVSSESSQVTSGPLLVAAGGGALGIGTLASTDLSVGSHTIAVTQASAGASLTSADAPATSTTITSGTNATLDYDLIHHAYPTLENFIEHMDRYSTLGCELLVAAGKVSRSWPAFLCNIVSVPNLTFVWNYIFRLGFLDGREGLLLHLYHAVYTSWKYSKAWLAARAPRS